MSAMKGIIFDKDGTLFDFASTWEAWAAAFLRRIASGEAHAAEIGQAIGFDLATHTFEPGSVVVAGTPGEITVALAPFVPHLTREALLDVLNQEAEVAPQVEAVPLIPFLQGLIDAGYKLGVVTNDAEKPARAHLASAGVTDFFAFIVGFDSGYGAKPEPGQLEGFVTATGLAAEEVVMVGDSTHDLIAGRRCGMRTVGVLTGLAGRDTLSPHADVVLPDIGEMTDWLASQNA